MYENVTYLHLIVCFWVSSLSVGVLTILIMFQMFVLNSESTDQLKRDFTLILNILKIKIILNYTKSLIL